MKITRKPQSVSKSIFWLGVGLLALAIEINTFIHTSGSPVVDVIILLFIFWVVGMDIERLVESIKAEWNKE